jgi:predicted alpha-1,2-mannosidase
MYARPSLLVAGGYAPPGDSHGRLPRAKRRVRPRRGVGSGWVILLLIALNAVSASSVRGAQPDRDLASYVDPFIGTGPAPTATYGQEFDGGDVFPGAAYPTGMLYWSPDTVEHNVPGGYFYPDRTLRGFSLTHFSGRGCTVYLDLPILPINGSLDTSPRSQPAVQRARFSHVNETAQPGYYAVGLDSGIQVELAVTPRTGAGRFTFPAASSGTLLVDAGGSVNDTFDGHVSIDPARQLLTGYVESQVGCGIDHYTLYFAIAFDRPFASYGTWAEDRLDAGSKTNRAAHTGAYLTFDTSTLQQVQLKPAISYVSVENALGNLETENPAWDFGHVRDAARAAWNDVLGQVQVSGGSERLRTIFYTALYHTFFHPNLFSDANGEYVGFDDRLYRVAPGDAHYHNIPGWDEYRTLIQLRAILAPDQASDIIQSLVDDALQGGGGMPRWEQANRNSAGMVGDSPGVFVANAYAFGARGFDTASALQALDFGASTPGALSGGHLVREWLEPWLALGYIPDQPSITLEYATDDFAIAQFAGLLGDTSRRDLYLQRAANWVKTFNDATGFVESRDSLGRFPNADHSHYCCGFVEGNAAQYTWMVPFDYTGLFSRLGGNAAAVARLDEHFRELNAGPNRPHAWMGNQPSLNAPWAYNFAGAGSRTQAVVRRIQMELFDTSPGGLPGNDDGGTTSAWYVFSALGLYPAIPGVGGLTVGSPLFEDASIRLRGGTLRLIGHDAAEDAPYVQAVLFNGVPIDTRWIDWSALQNGATLEFWLGTASPRQEGGQEPSGTR